MVIAHAPVIILGDLPVSLPLLDRGPSGSFHLSLLIRVSFLAREAALPWRFGGAGSVCVFLLFVVTTASVIIVNTRRGRSVMPEISLQSRLSIGGDRDRAPGSGRPPGCE